MNTAIKPKAIIKLLRDSGPMTAQEVRFAFSWPSNIFAVEALKLTEELTGDIGRLEGWYAAAGHVDR